MPSSDRHRHNRIATLLGALVILVTNGSARAQALHEGDAIQYETAPVHDRVTELQDKLEQGDASLAWDGERGYLESLLKLLDVPTSSQGLVFSKTSLQLRKISRKNPRAIYFNDDCYVGYCQHGDVLEIASIDPQQGLIFYTLEQEQTDKPKFVRDKGNCLSCHATTRTQGVPGSLVRSVYPDSGGTPLLGSGTFTSDDRSPFHERWGGWYVSGTHGDMRHMGNVFAAHRHEPEKIDPEKGANLTDLSSVVETKPYPTPHSDIVALMVLEHQTQMQNLLTLANFETRSAMHYDGVMNEVLGRPKEFQSESTQRRIAAAGEKVVRALLFSGEFKLTSPVQGTSGFAEEFTGRGYRDGQGRSLRDFDLQTRLFRHPCSYLIESAQFDALPGPMRQYVDRRLREVLTGDDQSAEFAHLSAEDRRTILEILRETHPDRFASIERSTAESAD